MGPPFAGNEPDPGPAADERLTILAALSRMSPDDRVVLGLRFAADLEVPDLAAALGIRLGTAKARLHRALRRLAIELTKYGEDDEL
jgi:DNA-directed RNA polymerase specialized sigma24 family protein